MRRWFSPSSSSGEAHHHHYYQRGHGSGVLTAKGSSRNDGDNVSWTKELVEGIGWTHPHAYAQERGADSDDDVHIVGMDDGVETTEHEEEAVFVVPAAAPAAPGVYGGRNHQGGARVTTLATATAAAGTSSEHSPHRAWCRAAGAGPTEVSLSSSPSPPPPAAAAAFRHQWERPSSSGRNPTRDNRVGVSPLHHHHHPPADPSLDMVRTLETTIAQVQSEYRKMVAEKDRTISQLRAQVDELTAQLRRIPK